MIVVNVDFETYSACDLKKCGSYVYAAHPSTRILMMAWRIAGNPTQLWRHGDMFPPEILVAMGNGAKLAGWNSVLFERLIWRDIGIPQHGFPPIDDDVWIDTMHQAVSANLPRGLEGAAKAVGATVQKDRQGHLLMLKISNAGRTPWPPNTADIDRLGAYCIQDVETEVATGERLPPWPPLSPWDRMPAIDRRINDRGVLVDMAMVHGMARAASTELVRLDAEMAEVMADQKMKTSNVGKLKLWLLAQGVKLPKKEEPVEPEDETEEDAEEAADDKGPSYRLRKSDVANLLADPDLPKRIGKVLQIRMDAAKVSTRKLAAALNAAGADGRVRGGLILMGAQATGRWSSGLVQWHNLPRNALPNVDDFDSKLEPTRLRALMDLVLTNAINDARSGDADWIRAAWGPVLPFLSRMLRRIVSAPTGKTLLQGDFSAIEARITAWLAGQTDTLEAFRRGEDVYKLQAMGIYSKPLAEITKPQRQMGKISVLACGFGGGPGVFAVMAMNYGVLVRNEEARAIVKAWRAANERTVKFWYAMRDAMVGAVNYPGHEFPVGPTGYVMFQGALCCRLPSGRMLRYWAPKVEKDKYDNPVVSALVVKGRAIFRRSIWHGLSVENAVQAAAADLLASALANLEDAGFETVLHVHDSAAAEVNENRAECLLPVFEQAMTSAPRWATGLPLTADCHFGPRFG